MSPILLLTLSAGLAVPAAAQDMIAVTHGGDALLIDSSTGASSYLGPVGYSPLNSMAKDPATGKIYASHNDWILEINPATGAGTVLFDVDHTIRSMAFHRGMLLTANDDVWAVQFAYRDDYDVGNFTFSYPGVQGLASANDRLYAWDTGGSGCHGKGLIYFDSEYDHQVDVNPLLGNQICDVESLCSTPDGRMFAVGNHLYQVDLQSGALTRVGTGGYGDVRGAEFLGPGWAWELTRTGTCPGPVSVSGVRGTPNAWVVLLSGKDEPYYRWTHIRCPSIWLPVRHHSVRGLMRANAAGTTTFSLNVPPSACGRHQLLVLMETQSCTLSNSVVL